MSKLVKGVLGLLAILLIVICAGVAYLILGVDPNTYKPELEKLAAENAVSLKIHGDLSWTLFPTLAIKIGSTELSSAQHSIPQTTFQQASLALDWKSLLNRKISFNAIEIRQADITIRSEQQARNVAALPAAPAANLQHSGKSDTDTPFQLTIDRFSLVDSRIELVSEDNSRRVLESIQFFSTGPNFEQHPFPVELSFSTPLLSDEPSVINLKIDLQLNSEKQQFDFNGNLAVDNPGIKAHFKASYDASAGSLKVTQLDGNAQSARFQVNTEVADLTNTPVAKGNLNIENLKIREWLPEPPEGITQLSINTDFSASEKAIQLKQYRITLDDFTGAGAFSLNLIPPRQLEMSLKGNTLELPASGDTEQNQNSAAMLTPLLAPLALLDGGKGHIELSLDRLKQAAMEIQKLHLNLFANGNVIHVADLSGDVFGGQFQLDTKINLSGKTPTLIYKAALKGINLKQALPEQKDLSGKLDLNFNGVTSGDDTNSLIANINGSGKFSVLEPVINNINVERNYCEIASLIESENTGPQQWSNNTMLGNLSGDITIKEQIVTLPAFTTALGNLAVRGNGKVSLEAKTYNMLITTNLQGDRTSATGCIVKSKRIRNRDIPMRCKGSFGENTKNSCLPDENFVNQLLKEKLAEKLSDKLFKPEKKSSADTQDPEQQSKDELKQQAIDSLLRGIFKK